MTNPSQNSSSWFNNRIIPVILAGGLGSRFRPIMKDLPKVLAPVAGRPFIHYLLDQLLATGFKETIISVGFRSDIVQSAIGSQYQNLTIHYSNEESPLGTGGAIRKALSCTEKKNLLIMNGDSYAKVDLSAFCTWYIEKGLKAAMVLGKTQDSQRFGSVILSPAYLVESFQEKYSGVNSTVVNAGIYLFYKKIIEKIPADCNFSLEKQLFPKLANKVLYAYPHIINFYDIGTPESYKKAGHFFLDIA